MAVQVTRYLQQPFRTLEKSGLESLGLHRACMTIPMQNSVQVRESMTSIHWLISRTRRLAAWSKGITTLHIRWRPEAWSNDVCQHAYHGIFACIGQKKAGCIARRDPKSRHLKKCMHWHHRHRNWARAEGKRMRNWESAS